MTGAAALGLLAAFSIQTPASAPDPAIAGRLSPSGGQFAFLAGDSLYVTDLPAAKSHRILAGGLSIEAGFLRKQLQWSPDSRMLLFRRGVPPAASYAVVTPATGRIQELFPDSLRGKLRTFGNVFTAGPAWSPDARRVAILAGLPGELGNVNTIWVANVPDGSSGPRMRPVVADGVEKTAVAWMPAGLAWASRSALGEVTIAVGKVGPESIAGVRSIALGRGRVTDLLPGPGDSLLLAPVQGGGPHLIAVGPALARREANLPAVSYIAWLNERELLAFRSPTPMAAELVAVAVGDGSVRSIRREEGLLADATFTAAGGRPRLAFARENGSQPRSYAVARIGADGSLEPPAAALPPAFHPRPDRWITQTIRWNAEDGAPLEAQLLRPPAVPRGTVVVPYGGYRNAALSSTYFLDVLLRQLLAEGWQVLRPNTRGVAQSPQTSGYGAFQLADTELLLEMLRPQGVVETGRIAVIGHSHGGAMAYYYATHSKKFCAIVAVNGRADWIMQAQYGNDGILPGPIGAAPADDPELYRALSPAANAKSVAAPMLLVAGQHDGQLLPINVRTMADSLTAYGKDFSSMVFPDEGHLIERPENRTTLLDEVRRTLRKGCGG